MPAVAALSLPVMFSMLVSTSAICVGQRSSSARDAATKPSFWRSWPGFDNCARHDSTQWWLVSIRPSGETNDAVQPDSRTVDWRTWSSQAGVMSTPNFLFTADAGKLSKVHMPSSARVATGAMTSRAADSARNGAERRCDMAGLDRGGREAGTAHLATTRAVAQG